MTQPDYGAPPFNEGMLRQPSASRISHLLVGGQRDAYEPDTDLKTRLEAVFDGLERAARISRAHRTLTARYLARRGFRQYLDLGCGYPSPDTSHPDIHLHYPDAPVVYIEADRLAYAHARALAFGANGVHHVLADLRRLPELLADLTEITRGALRRDLPVAVFATDTLQWIPDHDLDQALAALRAWLPAGSALSITHPTADFGQEEVMSQLTSLNEEADITYLPRPYSAVARMFGGWIQQGPGIQAVARWHADHPDHAAPGQASAAYAGIAVKSTAFPAPGRGAGS
ncbi:SAM-dependent methyltransferase [Streptomyces sp. IBSNAI002]|uniref:SAM-dependent methyltransferase n=1 Tax=Streptomyces sp. IBSNAI002 TaxID=3457500 RepID=UPI003FCF02E5